MGRYAERNNFIKNLKTDKYGETNVNEVMAAFEKATADVAPKSEVAREIFEEIEREINDAMQSNYKVLPIIEESEALWNRVNGKIDALRGIDGFLDELKAKYTEGKAHENTERCVVCGEVIPEGRQVCPLCEKQNTKSGLSQNVGQTKTLTNQGLEGFFQKPI